MKQQGVMQIGRVREKYVREAGAIPSHRTAATADAALIAPASLTVSTNPGPDQVLDLVPRTGSGPESVSDLDRS